mmetsp:Transcript_7360/g.13655  ORF Transcript_7360/g.13655 Transcript_7360/m.13655 type:complete len:342 (+) Transcript_7360:3990-5015(+)
MEDCFQNFEVQESRRTTGLLKLQMQLLGCPSHIDSRKTTSIQALSDRGPDSSRLSAMPKLQYARGEDYYDSLGQLALPHLKSHCPISEALIHYGGLQDATAIFPSKTQNALKILLIESWTTLSGLLAKKMAFKSCPKIGRDLSRIDRYPANTSFARPIPKLDFLNLTASKILVAVGSESTIEASTISTSKYREFTSIEPRTRKSYAHKSESPAPTLIGSVEGGFTSRTMPFNITLKVESSAKKRKPRRNKDKLPRIVCLPPTWDRDAVNTTTFPSNPTAFRSVEPNKGVIKAQTGRRNRIISNQSSSPTKRDTQTVKFPPSRQAVLTAGSFKRRVLVEVRA